MHVTIQRRVSAVATVLSMAVLLAGSTAYAGQRDSSATAAPPPPPPKGH
jgi:hypothetical protein